MVLLQDYKSLFEGAGTNPGEKTLEDKFFEHEVNINFYSLVLKFGLDLGVKTSQLTSQNFE